MTSFRKIGMHCGIAAAVIAITASAVFFHAKHGPNSGAGAPFPNQTFHEGSIVAGGRKREVPEAQAKAATRHPAGRQVMQETPDLFKSWKAAEIVPDLTGKAKTPGEAAFLIYRYLSGIGREDLADRSGAYCRAGTAEEVMSGLINAALTDTKAPMSCMNISVLYVAIARAAGLESGLVEVTKDERGKYNAHCMAYVKIHGRLVLVDNSHETAGFDAAPPRRFRVLDDDGAKAMYHVNLSRDYGLGNDFGAARRAAESACRLDPESIEAWTNLGGCAIILGKLDIAKNALKNALAIDPHYPPALMNMCSLACSEGGGHWKKDAKRYYDEALANDPDGLLVPKGIAKRLGREFGF